jgi:dephospho-CoA kinase
LVHPAVKADFVAWTEQQQGDYVILESALLFEAGLDALVDAVVAVLAPEALRVERVRQRDGVSEEQVRSRMAAQLSDEELHRRATVTVVNIFEEDLEAAVQELDRRFRQQ